MAAGVKRVMLPQRNKKDLEDLSQTAHQQLEFIFLNDVEQAVAVAIHQEAV